MNTKSILLTFLLIIVTVLITTTPEVSSATISSSIVGLNADGRIRIEVHSFGNSSSIAYYPYDTEIVGFVWAWVDISITNTGLQDVSTNSLYAYLKDSENHLYEYSYTASPSKLQLVSLPPNDTIRGEIYFEIPDEATIVAFLWSDWNSYIPVPESTSTPQILPPTFLDSVVGVNSDNRMQLQVHNFQNASFIPYYPYDPDTVGFVWAWVDISITNTGLQDVSTNSLYAYLKDSENHLYEYSYTASPSKLQLVSLPPNDTIRGEIYFEIPDEATIVAFLWSDWNSNITIPEFSAFVMLLILIIVTLGIFISRNKLKTISSHRNIQTRVS